MDPNNSKYFCILKGDWQERFFELIEMFQISLHKKFAIGVPQNPGNQYNRIIVYGVSMLDESSLNKTAGITDEEIFDSFYKSHPTHFNNYRKSDTVSEFENPTINIFEDHILYN